MVLPSPSVHDGTPAQLPGIALEREIEMPGSTITILSESAEQDVHRAAENAGYTNTPTNEAPSSVDTLGSQKLNLVIPFSWNFSYRAWEIVYRIIPS